MLLGVGQGPMLTLPTPRPWLLRLASTNGRQPFSLRLRLALRCPDSFSKYFYGRKACTLLGKASVSNFTVSHSLSLSEKHRLWPVCWLFLASWLPLRTLLRFSSSCSVTATFHSFGWHPTATVSPPPATPLHGRTPRLRSVVVLHCLGGRCQCLGLDCNVLPCTLGFSMQWLPLFLHNIGFPSGFIFGLG